MRKKYIQPVACSIEIGEEELICLSKFNLEDRSGEYNGQWYWEGQLISGEDEYYQRKNGTWEEPTKMAIIWSDMEVADW